MVRPPVAQQARSVKESSFLQDEEVCQQRSWLDMRQFFAEIFRK
ncbi:hypothetical protein [Nostoc sp. FACHB-110]|nr:hypothetical protein [Nostoc sp. FACHB-110]